MSAEFDQTKAAFEQMLDVCGVPIRYNGIEKRCITGAIEKDRVQQVAGFLPEAATQADMLVEDFEAFGEIIGRQSVVEIDGTRLLILAIDSDPQDPCVHFILKGDK